MHEKPLTDLLAAAERAARRHHTLVLVEGTSDRHAVETAARLHRRDLRVERIAVLPTGGATSIGHFVAALSGRGVRLAGLCDAGEEHHLRRALRRAGVDLGPDRIDLEAAGFFVCDADLEDELIRALGADEMLRLLETQGHLRRFGTFQKQPAQQGKTIEAQIHRFLGNHKVRYGTVLVEALHPSRMPQPLSGLIAHL